MIDYYTRRTGDAPHARDWLLAIVLVLATVALLAWMDTRTASAAPAQRTVCQLSESQAAYQRVCRAAKTTTAAERAAKRAAEGRTASRVRRWGR